MQRQRAKFTQEEFNLTMKLLSDLEFSIKDASVPHMEHIIYTEWRSSFKTRNGERVYIFPPSYDECARLMNMKDTTFEVARPLYDSHLCDIMTVHFMRHIESEIEGFELISNGFRFYDIDDATVGKVITKKSSHHATLNTTKIMAMLYIINNKFPEEFNEWSRKLGDA